MPLHLFPSSPRATHLLFLERFSAAPVLHLLSPSPSPCLPSGDPVARPSSPYSQPQPPLRPIPSCHPQGRRAATTLSQVVFLSSDISPAPNFSETIRWIIEGACTRVKYQIDTLSTYNQLN